MKPEDKVLLIYKDFEGVLCGCETTYAAAAYRAFDIDELDLDPKNVVMIAIQDGQPIALPGVRGFATESAQRFGDTPVAIPLITLEVGKVSVSAGSDE